MRKIALLIMLPACLPINSQSLSNCESPAQSQTQVVLLGAGTPSEVRRG